MAEHEDIFQQLFANAGDSFDASAYLELAAPLDQSTLDLSSFSALPVVSPNVSSAKPTAHERDSSPGSISPSMGQHSFVAPADLSPPHAAGGVGRRSGASSRRQSGDQPDQQSPTVESPVSEKSAGSSTTTRKKASTTEEDGGGSGKKSKGNGGNGNGKKTRNRKPSSCAACRKRKLRCNRADPCDQCTAKGEAHLCNWEGAEPLYKVRNEADTEELKNQVARLESLVRYLTSQRKDDDPFEQNDGGTSPPASVVQFPSKTTRQGSTSRGSQASQADTPKSSFAMDLRANDLCEGLGQLAIKEFVVVEGSGTDAWAPGGTGRGLEFIAEATDFVATMPQQFGVAQAPASGVSQAATSRYSAGTMSGAAGSPVGSTIAASTPASSPASMLSPSPLGTASLSAAPPPLSDVLKFLPTHKQAMSAYTYFSGYVSWYAHPVHLSTFEAQWKQLQVALSIKDEEQRNREIDVFFLATFLGVLATGLAMMPVKRAIRDGFGSEQEKDKLVDKWLEGAMVALTCGRFLDNPSVEAVRAAVVLSTFFVFVATGERSGAGMGLLSLVVQIALSLGLHRDPDRSPGKYTFFEAEERRRLFWSLFSLCILSSASLSRTWAVFDLNSTDCKLPLDLHDHEILDEETAMAALEKRRTKFEETPMSSLICKMKLAVLARKMNDRAFGIHPVPYEEILALDAELREFEESIPSRYQLRLDPSGALIRPSAHVTVTEMRACMVQISLAGEFLRLHRPWLLLSANDPRYQYSRNQALQYAKLLLAVYRSPSCSKAKWGGLSYKATNAAIVLAIDILAFPEGSEVSQLKSIVNAVQRQIEAQAPFSSLCRKGARVIRFLLDKEASLAAQRDQRRRQKRSRADDTTAFPSRSLRDALDPNFPPPPQFMLDRDHEEESLPHKGRADDYFSSTLSANFPTTDLHGSAAHLPRHPPLPLPRHRAHLPPPAVTPDGSVLAGPSGLPVPVTLPADAANFVNMAGAFDFNFHLPLQPAPLPYASPAPTTYPSPYGPPPVYAQPPLYSSRPSSQITTPVYALPPSVPSQTPHATYDSKNPLYPPADPAAGTYTLPRY
ncbi:hypothetical protein JCM11251_000314 [Rhodosporidiobolus azoricus]